VIFLETAKKKDMKISQISLFYIDLADFRMVF